MARTLPVNQHAFGAVGVVRVPHQHV